MHDIRLIVSDMDGTMLSSEKQILPATAQALRAAQQKGVIVGVCSGRFPQFVSCKLHEAGLSCHVVGANGAMLWDDEQRRMIAYHPIAPSSAVRVNALLAQYNAYCFLTMPSSIVTNCSERPFFFRDYRDGIWSREYGMHFDNSREKAEECAQSGEVIKFDISFKGVEDAEGLKRELAQVPGLSITTSSKTGLEIMREGIDKCFGMETLAKVYGVDMQQVMAFGDFTNDIPMLRAAGLGVAMGNALEEVKAAADYVTETNDNDGIARAIEKFLL